jgi:DNA-binding response OmpR family regulator
LKKKVLIIENDPEIQEVVAYILENEGYLVSGTPHLPPASLLHHQPDLILLDERVNLIEGHMLCKEIKAVEAFKCIPVIIFSTSADIIEIAKNCNADGYVHKPFDLIDLVTEVKKHLPPEFIPPGH